MPRSVTAKPLDIVTIHDLTHEGVGVAKVDGKTVFVTGALPEEIVQIRYTSRKRNYDAADLVEIKTPSPNRVEPRCRHFGVCGGCNLQHLAPEKQIQFKHKILQDNLQRIGHVTPEHWLEPLTGNVWGYRRKARLGSKYVTKKQKQIIGFREKNSHFLADLERCEVLAPEVGEKLPMLASMIRGLSCYQQIPQVEVAVGDNAVALVIRHLQPLTPEDIAVLTQFAQQQQFHIYLQPGNLQSIHALYPTESKLFYKVDQPAFEVNFLPADFIQVNRHINQIMVERVLALLDLQPNHKVLELFSGLGNFTLPIARRVTSVAAIEGESGLVERARANARHNQLHNIEHHVADLTKDISIFQWLKPEYDRLLLDPPRTGAVETLSHIGKKEIRKIVYVSCNPSTLARDAGILVNEYGYQLEQAGVMDMFPHTAHVESLAVFSRK